MKNNRTTSTSTQWLTSFLVAFLVTGVLFASALYIFKIPFQLTNAPTTSEDDAAWTPRDTEDDDIVPISPALPPEEAIACTMDYNPVCGINGRDYSNACMATAAKVAIAYTGSCNPDTVVDPIPMTPTIDSTGTTTTWPAIIASGQVDLSTFSTGSYHIYENKSFGYSLALPKFSYYQGLGARDGSSHALAVGLTSTGAEDTNADVVVYFYRTTPATPPTGGQEVVIPSGSLYIVTNASGPRIDQIVETITTSVR